MLDKAEPALCEWIFAAEIAIISVNKGLSGMSKKTSRRLDKNNETVTIF